MKALIAALVLATDLSEDPHLWHRTTAVEEPDSIPHQYVTHTPDAGADSPVIVYPCPDAPLVQKVDGGYVVSDARAARLTCQLAACEEHRDRLLKQKDAPDPLEQLETLPPSWQTWTMGIVLAAAGGAVFGIWLGLKVRD